MKHLVIIFAWIVLAASDVSHLNLPNSDYLPPNKNYLPPTFGSNGVLQNTLQYQPSQSTQYVRPVSTQYVSPSYRPAPPSTSYGVPVSKPIQPVYTAPSVASHTNTYTSGQSYNIPSVSSSQNGYTQTGLSPGYSVPVQAPSAVYSSQSVGYTYPGSGFGASSSSSSSQNYSPAISPSYNAPVPAHTFTDDGYHYKVPTSGGLF